MHQNWPQDPTSPHKGQEVHFCVCLQGSDLEVFGGEHEISPTFYCSRKGFWKKFLFTTMCGSAENIHIIPLSLHVVFFSSPTKADCYAKSRRLGHGNSGINGSVVSKYKTEDLPIVYTSSAALANTSEALLMLSYTQGTYPRTAPKFAWSVAPVRVIQNQYKVL